MTEQVRIRYKYITDQRWFERVLEIFPGLVSWTLLIGPIVLSFFHPILVAYFIVGFDLFWLIKALRMSMFLIIGYRRLRIGMNVNWPERLQWLEAPGPFIKKTDQKLRDLLRRQPRARHWFHLTAGGRAAHRRYRALKTELDTLKDIEARQTTILKPHFMYHLAIIATYNEPREILESTVVSLVESAYPSNHIMLVIAYEERGGEEVRKAAEELVESYGKHFAYAEAIMHPDGIPGEYRGKGGNITYAGRRAATYIQEQGIDPEHVIVTTLDADNKPDPQYFACLSYVYAMDPNRLRKSYQPIPMFFNNIWDVPAPMRVIATGNSFWMIIEMNRPHRLRNFSSHAQPLRALIDTDFWSVTSPVEDGHQFWRSYFAFNGDYSVVPLPVPVYQDAVLAETYPKTFIAQYKQLRRWAYGVSDFPYVVRHAIRNKEISLGSKLVHIWRLFEGHISWATATLIITFVAFLPLYLNPKFSHTASLAWQLPIIASRLQSIAMVGLIITVSISVISLPPRPERYGHRRTVGMILQWVLLPVTGILFNAIAAIDAQTRLMFGRYLGFQVTEKSRRS